ncbi:MAG TPA: transcriptional repressor LexA [Ignavibacteriaceae bacterium]|jgi:repressor LexA|nr:MAG: LexA repressor [Ignavibacteria bacterium ADurb.Bin266]OQY73072.1 MAG: repressor LexA [Ignavibacteriales bacterium UTCHB2]HQF41974.1 transcriptional repressor LexA [Ignavibacteriaceae bacterium]HQI40111.1 transcriptional repressor LexA [Ignavibacteriaceae bacterium]HQJ46942.1 transcriptional repressor LexA [Ignavibacteriaceae bacterium]
MRKELTETQKNILDFLIDQIKGKGIPPTLADIANYFGYANRATVQQHLQAIEKKGYIKKTPKLSRGIELTLEDKFFVPKPILGEVAAGNPLTIYPDAIDTVKLPTIAKMPQDSFLLRVKGDSLKDAYIFSGDIVIVNPNLEPKNGQIVVAILDDAAVVKRFYKKKNEIELVSENPEYKPIVIDKKYASFNVVGIVIGIYRSMDKRAG